MADTKSSSEITATLNQVVDLLGALTSGNLGRLIAGVALTLPDCDYHCGCRSNCHCRGSVAEIAAGSMSFPEFLAMREARLAELKREIESLQVPDDIK